MNDSQVNNIISSSIDIRGFELLESQKSVGSLSATDPFDSVELKRFWTNSRNIKDSLIIGSKAFSGEMLKPYSEGVLLSPEMLDLMVNYYTATYESLKFRKPFGEGSEDTIVIQVKLNKYGKC